MTRIFVDFLPHACLNRQLEKPGGELVEINTELSHHLRDVLRLQQGQQVTVVLSETGEEYLAILVVADKDRPVKLQILKKLDRKIIAPVIASLLCGMPKGSHADQICEQISQLGINNIVFWCADRSIAKPKQVSSKLERWQKIAEASARQSKQNLIPTVKFIDDSAQFFDYVERQCCNTGDLLALCSLQPEAKPFSGFVAPSGRAHIIIGPEGDFSSAELEKLNSLRAVHLSLGPLVLRVETATVVAVSMGLAAWGWR